MKTIFPHLGESIIYGLLKKNPMFLQRLLNQFDEYELAFDPAISVVPPNSARCWLEAPDGTARVGFDSEHLIWHS